MVTTDSNLPESPAIKTLSLPMFLPFSVNGLLLGILMLGITNCEALLLSILPDGTSFSSSPLDKIAWLAASSVKKSISEFRRELGLLFSEPRKGESGFRGLNGREAVFSDLLDSEGERSRLGLRDDRGDGDRDLFMSSSSSSPARPFVKPFLQLLRAFSSLPLRSSMSREARDAVVVSRLSTPKLLRFILSRDFVWLREERREEDSNVLSFAMKYVICGGCGPGTGVVVLSVKLVLRGRPEKASSPAMGRILTCTNYMQSEAGIRSCVEVCDALQ